MVTITIKKNNANIILINLKRNIKSKDQIREWLLENAVNENGILDLSNMIFNCDVDISFMTVSGSLNQGRHKVAGYLGNII